MIFFFRMPFNSAPLSAVFDAPKIHESPRSSGGSQQLPASGWATAHLHDGGRPGGAVDFFCIVCVFFFFLGGGLCWVCFFPRKFGGWLVFPVIIVSFLHVSEVFLCFFNPWLLIIGCLCLVSGRVGVDRWLWETLDKPNVVWQSRPASERHMSLVQAHNVR